MKDDDNFLNFELNEERDITLNDISRKVFGVIDKVMKDGFLNDSVFSFFDTTLEFQPLFRVINKVSG